MINVIAAVARNRAIGNENKLLYWLPNDLKRFKALTTGHTIIMAPDEDVYIIGGASVYSQCMDKADRLCLTEIDDTPSSADAFFPDYSGWKEVSRENHETDEKHAYRYSFVDYVR